MPRCQRRDSACERRCRVSEAHPKLDEARSEAIKLITSGRPFLMTLTPLLIDGEEEAPAPISCIAAESSKLDIVVHGMALHYWLASDLLAQTAQLIQHDYPGGMGPLKAQIHALLEGFTQQIAMNVDAHARVIPTKP